MYNNLYNTKITFIINGETYIYNAAPDVAFDVSGGPTIETVVTGRGEVVNYKSAQGAPLDITCGVTNVSLAELNLLRLTYSENLKNNKDYVFKIVQEGVNDLGESIKQEYINCTFAASPRQASLGQDLAVLTLTIKAGSESFQGV